MTQPFYGAELAAVHEADFADMAHSAAGVLLRRLAEAGFTTSVLAAYGERPLAAGWTAIAARRPERRHVGG